MTIQIEELLPENEMKKIENYINSGDYAKVNIAYTKIDKFIREYLIYIKDTYNIRKLDEAIKYLQIKYDELIEHNTNNIVLKNIINKFIEYKEMREKIKNIENDTTEKQRLIKSLDIRGLWNISKENVKQNGK
jgi:hypothetical protein